MKSFVLACMIVIGLVSSAYAVDISMSSSIQISNAPANSSWRVECGTNTGVYTASRQFVMSPGINTVSVYSIFSTVGNFFCRTAFVQAFGVGPFSSETAVTVLAPTLSAPSLTIVP